VLEIKLLHDAMKYVKSLDKITRTRIADKLTELAKDPLNIRTSKPLKGSDKRTARVGSYRILFMIVKSKSADGKDVLLVAAVGPRNQIYREA
jgi:mRNA-degrading endonuclease RelE of RelBE toxin-antitoxin system